MAKVFTGKVIIPGDKIDDYFKFLEAAEKACEPFRKYLIGLNTEFTKHISSRFSARTAKKHAGIVEIFIEFLCRHTDVTDIKNITRGIANTHFRQWYKRKVWDSSTPDDLKITLRKFFQFLADEKGIVNEKLLAGLNK